MSSTRWQIEPSPLAPGAGAQWLVAALVALGPFSLTMYQPALPAIARSLNIQHGAGAAHSYGLLSLLRNQATRFRALSPQ